MGKILLGLVLFIVLLLLFVRSPWGQGIIVDELVSYISKKTNTEVTVDRLFITFSGDVFLEGLYMEDKTGDTLVYSESLQADIALLPLIKGNKISVGELDWSGVRAEISRTDSLQGFNFDFLLEAFAAPDTTKTVQDTTSAGYVIDIGEMHFNDFDLSYNDAVSGIETEVSIGNLDLKVEEMDLDKMQFQISNVNLGNSTATFVQLKAAPETEDPESSPVLQLSLQDVQLENVHFNYQSVPSGTVADVDIAEFSAEIPQVDLGRNYVEIGQMALIDSEVMLNTTTSKEKVVTDVEDTETAFEWPEWTVLVNGITLKGNELAYFSNGARPVEGQFDPNAIALDDLSLNASNIYLREKSAGIDLDSLQFQEASGISLKKLTANLTMDDGQLQLSNFGLRLNDNELQGNLLLEYNSLAQFMEHPENARIEANLPSFQLTMDELFMVQPSLKSNEYLVTLSKKILRGNLQVQGTVSDLQVSEGNFFWGQNTSLSASGNIRQAMDPEKLEFDFPQFRINSKRLDIVKFVNEEDLGIKVPEELLLKGNISGTMEEIHSKVELQTSDGTIILDGDFSSEEGIAFDAELTVMELEVGEILQNEKFGELSLGLQASGSGANINTLDGVLAVKIDSFHYNGYRIEDFPIAAKVENGEGILTSNYKDENLDLELETFVQLDSVSPRFVVDLNIIGANLQALGLTKRDIRSAFELEASYEGNTEKYEISSHLSEGVAVYDNESYLLGDVHLDAFVRPDTTSVNINNDVINLKLRSNSSPVGIGNALQRHFERYLTGDKLADSILHPVQLQLDASVSEDPILTEVFLVNVDELDTIGINVNFNESERTLVADVELPLINYRGNEIDSLSLHLDSNKNDFVFDFSFNALNAGPLAIDETHLKGEIADQKLYLEFLSLHEEEQLVHVLSEISESNDSLRIHIDPSNLILNNLPWNIPENNVIVLGDQLTRFQNFILSRNGQQLKISNGVAEVEKAHIGMEFQNFNLASLLSYFNPEKPLGEGRLNGELVLLEPSKNTAILANLEIGELQILDVPVGRLTLDARAEGNQQYDFDLAIRDGNINLDLTGNYLAGETAAELNLDLILNKLEMNVLQGFSDGEISNAEGSISGEVKVTGTTKEPIYEGFLSFNNVGFLINKFNSSFQIANERMEFDNSGVYFDDFVIEDYNSNSFVVNGEVLTEELLTPSFDLQFEADNFRVLNSTSEDNELFYGTASFDAEASLTGDLEIPILDLQLDMGPNTDVTYVVPEASLEVVERDGVVVFVDRENPNNILTETEEESVSITGFILNSVISVGDEAVFKIILDQETGDNFQVSGAGDFNFKITENGRTTLTGRYELSDGHYEMSLYNLVNRHFDIMDGSTIVWAGDPFDANLDITAVYRVETSAASLMAPQTSGAGTQNQFRQELPFLVYLYIDGELTHPEISFGIGIPEEEQGIAGGQIYGRIQQLNQQENELNKQVFSLLVFNRFFPEFGSDGSMGGTASIARDNLTEALSDQLNMFSNRLLGESGLKLNFGLDSYTDYQGESPQDRTQLDISAQKAFLDDRLIVQVGSEVDIQGGNQTMAEGSPLIGNVSIEYLLTEDGRYRLQFFRRNEYENVIDGQLMITGIALIFTREFNEFRELWKEIFEAETKKTTQEQK